MRFLYGAAAHAHWYCARKVLEVVVRTALSQGPAVCLGDCNDRCSPIYCSRNGLEYASLSSYVPRAKVAGVAEECCGRRLLLIAERKLKQRKAHALKTMAAAGRGVCVLAAGDWATNRGRVVDEAVVEGQGAVWC